MTQQQQQQPPLFFERWAQRFEELLVPALGVEPLDLPERLTQRRGGAGDRAEIRTKVFARGGGAAEASASSCPVRRLRVTLVGNGEQLQAFNAAVYPAPGLGPLPVLGADVLSFNGHQRLLFGVDWSPMLRGADYAEEHISPHVAEVRRKHEALILETSGKFYGDAPEFFSPQMFFSRPAGAEALQPGAELWEVFEEYCSRYRDMLLAASPASSTEDVGTAEERQAAYDKWHAGRDPAVPIFKKLFGEDWTEEFTHEVLFPGSSPLA